MLLPLRYPRLWLAAGWVLIALAVVGSLLPAQNLPDVSASDKVQHMTAYALLSLWFSGIYPRSRYGAIAIGLFALGIGIEWAQGAMQYGRQTDPYDVLANVTGVAAGLIAAWLGLGGWAVRVENLVRRSG
jgi:hypothetical protein